MRMTNNHIDDDRDDSDQTPNHWQDFDGLLLTLLYLFYMLHKVTDYTMRDKDTVKQNETRQMMQWKQSSRW